MDASGVRDQRVNTVSKKTARCMVRYDRFQNKDPSGYNNSAISGGPGQTPLQPVRSL